MSRGRVARWLTPLVAAVVGTSVMNVVPAQAAGDIDTCVTSGRKAGFSGERFVTAVAVAMAESRCDPTATGVNPGGSKDRGLWQINDYWHSEVSDACAYNADCNAREAYRISESGSDWTQWTTYKSGAYRDFIDDARKAIGQPAPEPRPAKSINGDKYDDAIGIDPDGYAWVYFGKAGGGFSSSKRLGGGWNNFNRIAIGDSNADGLADLFATRDDHLYYWHNNGSNSFADAVRLGAGWNAVDYFSIVDFNGDNKADIVTRDGSTLNVYIGKGKGAFATPDVAGSGWTPYRRHTGADADGDGDGDLWATDADGDLYYWKRVGGSFSEAVKVGSGWNGFPQMTTMDINGDRRADIIAVRASDDTLWQWLGNGNGTVDNGTQIGHGWAGFRLAVF